MTFLHKNVNNVYIGYSQVSTNFEGSKIYDPPSNQQCDISLEVWDSAVQSSTENLMTEQLLQEGLCVYIYIYIYIWNLCELRNLPILATGQILQGIVRCKPKLLYDF